jgi:serine/threonine-protein kinase
MGCMSDKGDFDICPHCGLSEEQSLIRSENALKIRAVLQDRYIVGMQKDSNGESIGYIGYDITSNSQIYIREFMPENLCFRNSDGLQIISRGGAQLNFKENISIFLEYNRRLAAMRNLLAIIPIFDIFEENGTAYMISEWVENITLEEFIERSGGHIDWSTARPLFMPVISALSEIWRAGISHLGISPQNLIILRNGKMRLKGFSIPEVRKVSSDLHPEIFDGCAAIEQYIHGAPVDESTDIYGFVASLFFALTGTLPQNSMKRKDDPRLLIPTDLLKTIPPHIVTALANALQVNPKSRTQKFERLRAELSASPTVTMAIDDNIMPANKEKLLEDDSEKEKIPWYIIAVIILLSLSIIAALAYMLFIPKDNNQQAQSSSSNVSSVVSSSKAASSAPENSVDIPNLIGTNFDQAQKQASNQGNYQVKLSSQEFSDSVEEGFIISQTPEYSQGTKISKGSVIAVVVSKGQSKRKLPSISGMSLSEASGVLTKQGFVPKKGSEQYSETYSEGKVIDYEDYKAGQYLEYGATVNIIVSKGKSS